MYRIGLKMLMGDPAKYLGLVFGVTFATLLMAQQVSIFVGIMARTAGAIDGIPAADIWVMDTRVRYIEEVEPMRAVELQRVRAVSGVAWAVPFYKGLATIRMPDGLTQQVQLIGVDPVSLIGNCSQPVMGDPQVIQAPFRAMMDVNGYQFTWPRTPFRLGRELEVNDHRLTLDALCEAKPTFYTFPIVYVSYYTAMEIMPSQRVSLPFVLVKAEPGVDIQALKQRIVQQTGLQALSRQEFAWRSISYILERTGIPINFGITIFLGALIGAAITAQTFYIFVVENLKQFAAMKAVGVTNGQLLRMVLAQSAFVGLVGYGLGIGATALFFKLTAHTPALKGFVLHAPIMIGSFGVIMLIIVISIVFSLRKVFTLDPGLIFRG